MQKYQNIFIFNKKYIEIINFINKKTIIKKFYLKY